MKLSVDSSLVKADVDVDIDAVKRFGGWAKRSLLSGMGKLQKKLEAEPAAEEKSDDSAK